MRAFYLKHLSLLGSRYAPRSRVREVCRLSGEGRLRPAIHRGFPLEGASAAQALVESRDVFGRVILTLG